MTWLQPLAIAATLFGVGVTLLDFTGIIGDDDDSGADDFSDGSSESDPSLLGHDKRESRNPILAVLSVTRNFVYFCLGFGPTGWFASATGLPGRAALAWSAGVGVVTLVGVRLLRRILRSELTSEIKDVELLMESGEVIVGIDPEQLGRVRIKIGGSFVDRYARSRSGSPLKPGTRIQVVEIGEDCIYVEQYKE